MRHPKTDLHRSLNPILPPLPVLYRLSTWTKAHYSRPPPPVSALAALPSLTCSPSPCRPMHPRAAIPFLPPRPPSGRPPFAALGVIQAPLSTPVVSPFYVLSFFHHSLNHFSLLTASTCGPIPDGPEGSRVSISWNLVLLFRASSSPAPVLSRILVSSGRFSSSGRLFAR